MTFKMWKCYFGQFKDKKWHGKGTLTLANNFIFSGNFFQNLIHGKGSISNPKGEIIYIGNFRYNIAQEEI